VVLDHLVSEVHPEVLETLATLGRQEPWAVLVSLVREVKKVWPVLRVRLVTLELSVVRVLLVHKVTEDPRA